MTNSDLRSGHRQCGSNEKQLQILRLRSRGRPPLRMTTLEREDMKREDYCRCGSYSLPFYHCRQPANSPARCPNLISWPTTRWTPFLFPNLKPCRSMAKPTDGRSICL